MLVSEDRAAASMSRVAGNEACSRGKIVAIVTSLLYAVTCCNIFTKLLLFSSTSGEYIKYINDLC